MAAQNSLIINNVNSFAQLALANVNIMAGIASVTDGEGDINDLSNAGTKTQTILAALKVFIDNMVARKMLKIELDSATGSVKVQFYVNYNSSLTAQTSLVLYEFDIINFFTATSSSVYEVKANGVLYPSPANDTLK